MKKIYLSLLAFIATSIALIAQPILTHSNYVPAINDTQLFYVADTNFTFLDNTIGADVIFDYTTMRGDTPTVLTQTQYVVNPASTPLSSTYPSATHTDTTAGNPGNFKYNQDFTDSLDLIGLVFGNVPTFGQVVAEYNNDPEILMKFPFQYGDSFTDNYGGQFTGQTVTTNGSGSVTVSADAWGTLKLPMGQTIDSVLRINIIEQLLTDTIFLPFPLPTILPIQFNAVQVNYYKPSINKQPLLSYVLADVAGDTTYTLLSQYPMLGVGVNELDKNINARLYPNPSNRDFTTLTFDLENNSAVKVTLTNSLGQNVKNVFSGNLQQGENQLKIKTATLSKGLYFISISVDNRFTTKKLIIE